MKYLVNTFSRILIFLMVLSLVIPLNTQSALAAESEVTTKIKHKPLKYFVSERRIRIETEVKDKEGINLVRCYFKAESHTDYVFVGMIPDDNDKSMFRGILPAPSKNTTTINYLFLVVNRKNQVVKTQIYEVKNEDKESIPDWQTVNSEGEIKVSTELAQAPAKLEGFTDSINMDIVESSLRFGVVAGLYTEAQMVTAGDTSTATSAGTVSASTGGVSTLAVVGGIIAVGAAAAVVAVGVNTYNNAKDVLNCDKPITITLQDSNCPNYNGIQIRTRNSGSGCTYDVINQGSDAVLPAYGSVTYSGTTSGQITIYDPNGLRFLWGDISLDLLSGNVKGSGQWTYLKCNGNWSGGS